MQDLREPLSNDELDFLDNFLLERVPDDADPDMDAGIIELSGLDGFFTAIVSGPNMIPPSQWLPALWGEAEPEFENEEDYEKVFMLLIRHMNSISQYLMASPDEFEPMFSQREVEGRTYTIVDEWCFGYLRGVSLDYDTWLVDDDDYANMMMPIITHGTPEGLDHLLTVDEPEADAMRNAVGPAAQWLHAYWLARREERAGSHAPLRREEPKVGRNDPCPCGSGKKYKKCCLH
jgi:uncharacterized protein